MATNSGPGSHHLNSGGIGSEDQSLNSSSDPNVQHNSLANNKSHIKHGSGDASQGSTPSPLLNEEQNNGGSAEPLQVPASQRSGDYRKLVTYGLDEKVAAKLDDIYTTGKLAHSDLDERALDALKEFPVDGALTVLKQFLDSNLEHVSNKSAYLCGVMKTYRQKTRSGHSNSPVAQSVAKGPDESKIKAILDRTGYSLDVTTGQRKYGGPPPNCDSVSPGNGCEVFCGKIPKDMYEDELIPLFEKCGPIWDLRLMMDPMTGLNRGYAFVTFINRDGAVEAVKQLNDFEIRKGKKIGVTISYNNHRLFVGNIPKNRDHDELFEEFLKHAPGLTEVIIYSSPDDRKKNRGFCFLEYESHKAASLAKRRLGTARVKVWGCDIIVDWADPQEEPDDDTMSKVKVLYVRNLTMEVTEERLKEYFEVHGRVDRVKKIKDYAFVHFEERESAVKAMDAMNSTEVGGSQIEISLAKPPSDKKKKEEVLRARERRMMQMMAQHRPPMIPIPNMRGGRGGFRGGLMGRSDFEFDNYEYYPYGAFPTAPEPPHYYDSDFYRLDDFYYDFGSPASSALFSSPSLQSSGSSLSRGRSFQVKPPTRQSLGRGRGMGLGRGMGMGPSGQHDGLMGQGIRGIGAMRLGGTPQRFIDQQEGQRGPFRGLGQRQGQGERQLGPRTSGAFQQSNGTRSYKGSRQQNESNSFLLK